jgi:hypothetical protein
MEVSIIETLEGTFRVWWVGPDRFMRTLTPFHCYRDAERFALQLKCRFNIETMLLEQEGMTGQESEAH